MHKKKEKKEDDKENEVNKGKRENKQKIWFLKNTHISVV